MLYVENSLVVYVFFKDRIYKMLQRDLALLF